MEYIDKSALLAEIDRQKIGYNVDGKHSVEYDTTRKILNIIDTLEVKEMDLEEALSDLDKDIKEFVTTEEFENESTTAGHYWVIAKHAFLLGLKAQKGEKV